jgi:hypothetical protein
MLPPDDYTLEATAEFDNITFGNDIARFLSDTTNNEYKITRSDFNSLRSIADNTGGVYSRLSDNRSLNDIISSSYRDNNEQDEAVKKYEKFNLWENRYILIAVIMLLAVEWFVKKRKNIP